MASRRRRIAVGCALTLAVLCVGTGIAVRTWWRHLPSAIRLVLTEEPEWAGRLQARDPAAVLDYVVAHRDDVALVAYTVAPDGTPAGAALLHQPDEPMPLASTMKIVVLGAYAREVVNRAWDPDETFALAEWERYWLPGTDGGAHPSAMERLGITGATARVTLDQLASAMIRESDNAATDFLLEHAGSRVGTLIADAGLTGQEPIHSLVGTSLSLTNHETGRLDQERLDTLLALSDDEYATEAARWGSAHLDDAWRTAEQRWRRDRPNSLALERAALHELMPQGTARDYAGLQARVATGTLLSAEVSQVMQAHLEWPMAFPSNANRYEAFGSKGGSLLGVLTEASYLKPKSGDFGGQTRVVVLFMRHVPMSAWAALSKSFAQQDFMVKLATDAEFAARVAEALR